MRWGGRGTTREDGRASRRRGGGRISVGTTTGRGQRGTRTSGNAVSRMAEDGKGQIDADVVEAMEDNDYDEDHRTTSSRVARLEAKLDRIDGGMHLMGGKLDEKIEVVLPAVDAAARAREEGRCIGRGAARRGRMAVRVGGGGGEGFPPERRREEDGKGRGRAVLRCVGDGAPRGRIGQCLDIILC
jgi:hypothetical protein